MTHKHADLIKNIKHNLDVNIKAYKVLNKDSFTQMVKIEFLLSMDDLQDIESLHGDNIVSQIIGDSVLAAVKNSIAR